MTLEFGYTLSSEEHGPNTLVDNAVRAEQHGFGFVSLSDHYHPWIGEQGHSPFAWAVLGGIAARTTTIGVGVGVTCPIMRIHPAVVAHAAATTAVMFEGRFFLGVGTGEALNEHITGERWPPPGIRRDMLDEAVTVMRHLWTGETVDHHGTHFTVENARLFDVPDELVPVIVSGFGDEAISLAGRIGDGYWGHSPERHDIRHFVESGGSGPRYGQIDVCWDTDADRARATVHRVWPNRGLGGQLAQDLPTWSHFEAAVGNVRQDDATADLPCGPDLDAYVAAVDAFESAGYDHVYFHQIGPNQDGFISFWDSELRPALSER